MAPTETAAQEPRHGATLADDELAHPARMLFAEELEANLEAIADEGVRLILETLPAYAEVEATEGTAHLRGNLLMHLRNVAEVARGIASEKAAMAYEASRRRAQQGFPLEHVLRSSYLMNHVMWDWLMSHPAFAHGRQDVLRRCWPIWLEYVDTLNSASSAAYVDTARAFAKQDLLARRRFVDQLLNGRLNAFDSQRAAQALDLDVSTPCRMVLIQLWSSPPTDVLETLLYEATEQLRPRSQPSPPATILDEAIVVLLQCRDTAVPEVRERLHRCVGAIVETEPVSASISRSITDLMDARAHHEECRQVARVGRNVSAVLLAEEVPLFQHAFAALHDSIDQICPPDLRSFVANHANHLPLWRETMDAHARTGRNVRDTAAALQLHANTVYYRLGQIGSASGRDLTSLSDFIDVWIALTYGDQIRPHGQGRAPVR